MSDSEDDFVEVSGYQSSDSEWEKISGYSSSEELAPAKSPTLVWPQDLVTSYYQPSLGGPQHLQDNNVVHHNTTTIESNDAQDDVSLPNDVNNDEENPSPPLAINKPKFGRGKERKKHHWDKVTLKRGHGAPYDPVEFLGITGGEKALLSHFSITTIGQLAYFNAMDFVSSTHPEKFAIILDLQERAYQAVTEYVTKASKQPDTVWGYLYLGDRELKTVLQRGFLDSDSLYFLWTPMPGVMYRDQLAIDDLVGMETKNRRLRSRYARFVKINLSKLCNKYYGRLYQRDPKNEAMGNKWMNVSLLEAAELSRRDDAWYSFEPGNEIFAHVAHGSIVIPTGRIPRDCMEMDKESCVFAGSGDSESSDDERDEVNPTVSANLEYFY